MATPASKTSNYVDWELAIAAAEKKRVVPVRADGSDWLRCVPAGKHELQYVDMCGANYRAGLEELLAAFKGNSRAVDLILPSFCPLTSAPSTRRL